MVRLKILLNRLRGQKVLLRTAWQTDCHILIDKVILIINKLILTNVTFCWMIL
jgi:hypothetical protein